MSGPVIETRGAIKIYHFQEAHFVVMMIKHVEE